MWFAAVRDLWHSTAPCSSGLLSSFGSPLRPIPEARGDDLTSMIGQKRVADPRSTPRTNLLLFCALRKNSVEGK